MFRVRRADHGAKVLYEADLPFPCPLGQWPCSSSWRRVSSSGAAGLTWDQVKARFEATNPALKADADNVDEMRAEEITAFLRPNPQFTLRWMERRSRRNNGSGSLDRDVFVPSVSYLHERDHKRELRLESAQEGTRITESQHEDLKRNLEFTLRAAFVQTLEPRLFWIWPRPTLTTTTRSSRSAATGSRPATLRRSISIASSCCGCSTNRRLQTAIVNLRTAKIQLLQLLNDRTPVDQFDVTGTFDFSDALDPLDNFRQAALDARPDLQAALADDPAIRDQPQAGRGQRFHRPDF